MAKSIFMHTYPGKRQGKQAGRRVVLSCQHPVRRTDPQGCRIWSAIQARSRRSLSTGPMSSKLPIQLETIIEKSRQ